jgi:hypothetical protein
MSAVTGFSSRAMRSTRMRSTCETLFPQHLAGMSQRKPAATFPTIK